jgi:hypothetical protein
LVGSQAQLPILDHSPFQSGNVASSNAAAPVIVAKVIVANVIVANSAAKAEIELRPSMRAFLQERQRPLSSSIGAPKQLATRALERVFRVPAFRPVC